MTTESPSKFIELQDYPDPLRVYIVKPRITLSDMFKHMEWFRNRIFLGRMDFDETTQTRIPIGDHRRQAARNRQ
jgi:hypothetical protein